MYFNNVGLVTDDQGDMFLYIPWKHIHGVWNHVVEFEKPYQTYPGQKFTRQAVGFILAHLDEELGRDTLRDRHPGIDYQSPEEVLESKARYFNLASTFDIDSMEKLNELK